ncbi:dolichyl-phosphate beta-glucosyltransferase [Bifidobacterium vespertilionis]|uniref:dolichyl-phosphate beta-glucosyltransferase n=2 Tax=Bifidobacterium vespertilionis TaxID=2562524 RepID=A0A5J5DUK0_9BIFI|nr:dolichyl-phosphate beta-glucosyltransferase [Bifidobacterium vespertilionis]KAA8820032.1 glycosyltransferase family 2 protein [Bifidobacterium vespertilionis]KAA8823736.1 glycosyltransferase family 2 protein [Bifidobacterium vespertilionis]
MNNNAMNQPVAAEAPATQMASVTQMAPATQTGPMAAMAQPNPDSIDARVGTPRPVDADIVIPVYNEQEQLAGSVITLMNHLAVSQREGWAYTWNIVIADNASTDATWSIAAQLSAQYPDRVRAVHIPAKGRGRALKLAWGESKARALAYMDVDLSTDIRLTGTLIGSLLYGGADVSLGCRLFDESDVRRSLKREVISRTYNTMLRVMLDADFHDAQCGFKAMTSAAAWRLLPLIEDNEWFFDTEMLLLAQALGMRVYEFPVRWVEDAGTTVNIPDTVAKDLKGMWRMRRTLKALRRGRIDQESRPHAAQPAQSANSAQSAQSAQPVAAPAAI